MPNAKQPSDRKDAALGLARTPVLIFLRACCSDRPTAARSRPVCGTTDAPVSARFSFRSPHSQLEADARQWLHAMQGQTGVRPLSKSELRRAFSFFDKDGSGTTIPLRCAHAQRRPCTPRCLFDDHSSPCGVACTTVCVCYIGIITEIELEAGIEVTLP